MNKIDLFENELLLDYDTRNHITVNRLLELDRNT